MIKTTTQPKYHNLTSLHLAETKYHVQFWVNESQYADMQLCVRKSNNYSITRVICLLSRLMLFLIGISSCRQCCLLKVEPLPHPNPSNITSIRNWSPHPHLSSIHHHIALSLSPSLTHTHTHTHRPGGLPPLPPSVSRRTAPKQGRPCWTVTTAPNTPWGWNHRVCVCLGFYIYVTAIESCYRSCPNRLAFVSKRCLLGIVSASLERVLYSSDLSARAPVLEGIHPLQHWLSTGLASGPTWVISH